MTTHEVVIAGGGPVGKMLGAELILAGIDVVVLERRPGPELVGSRAGGLQARALELLDQRGIVERFLAEGKTYPVAPFAAYSLDLSDFPTRHPYVLGLFQNHIERILSGWVGELGVDTLYDREVTGLRQDASGVGEPTLENIRRALITVYGRDFGVHSPTWISRFTDSTRQAGTYRAGRVLLAGDAAHIHHPVGGQGLSLGLSDAVNLGWKLAQVIRHISPDSLLDSYEAERHPATARALAHTMAGSVLLRPEARIEALRDILGELLTLKEPLMQLAGTMSGLTVHHDLGAGHPLLGRRMPDLDLDTAAGPLRTYTLLHRARPALISFGDPLDIAPWSDRVALVAASYDGVWELPVLGVVSAPTAVLVRPDGDVAWVGEGGDTGLREAMSLWFGAPVAA